MKLAIISHTEHYITSDGTIVGWSPTVNEINHLLAIFDEIYHIAMLYKGEAPPSTMAYADERIVFIPLKPFGGKTLLNKIDIVLQAPKVVLTVIRTLKKVDFFQLRTPTGMGTYLIPFLSVFSKKKGWYKYAGNWNQKNAPLGYALQRFMLKRQKRIVTINGQWESQPKHCITFENPCLTMDDLNLGKEVVSTKTVEGLLTFCFVGRLERAKGVEIIIKAFGELSDVEKECVYQVHFVGDGKEADYFKSLAKSITGIAFKFHGFLSREAVFKIYETAHIFMLPSMASEGFPKVIAEAMNFGCVPMVSNVSAISQYVNGTNGIVLSDITPKNLSEQISKVLHLKPDNFKQLNKANSDLVYQFTFENYNRRIMKLLNIC